MPNELLTASMIAKLGIELLNRQLVLLRTVSMIPGAEYAGPSGGTLTLRVPQPRVAHTQTPGTQIDFDDIDEVGVDVTVVHLYNAAKLTDEDLNLVIEDFGRQVITPMTAAVATGAENQLATAMNNLVGTVTTDDEPAEVEAAVLEARATLTRNGAPLGGRWLAVSPEFATPLLTLDKVSRVDASGSSSALRDALIGNLYGFTVVESAGLNAGDAVAYHSSGFGAAVRPPAPASGADTATANVDGVGLRVVRDFSINFLSELAAVSTFAGAAVVYEDGEDATDLKRVIKLEITGS